MIDLFKVYLCGPIANCTDEECKDWREDVKKAIGDKHCLDPMCRDYRMYDTGEKKYTPEIDREVVELDKLDILQSEVVLVNYVKPSVGTSMEVLYAWMHHKTIIVVCKEGMILSPWLRYHSNYVVHSFDDALAIISVLMRGEV